MWLCSQKHLLPLTRTQIHFPGLTRPSTIACHFSSRGSDVLTLLWPPRVHMVHIIYAGKTITYIKLKMF